MLVESHICLLDKITNTTIFTEKTYFKNYNSKGNIFFLYIFNDY